MEDIEFKGQMVKILKMQWANRNTSIKKSILTFPRGNLIAFLLFNFYMHLLDQFVVKTIKSVISLNSITQKCKYIRKKRWFLGKFKKLTSIVNCQTTKKEIKIEKKSKFK
jgi:hypothetical protein